MRRDCRRPSHTGSDREQERNRLPRRRPCLCGLSGARTRTQRSVRRAPLGSAPVSAADAARSTPSPRMQSWAMWQCDMMKQPSPKDVTPPPPVVPPLKCAYSAMRQRSPISSEDADDVGSCLRSNGAAPRVANACTHVCANECVTCNAHVRFEPYAICERYIAAHDAVWANLNVAANLCSLPDNCCRVNAWLPSSCRGGKCGSGAAMAAHAQRTACRRKPLSRRVTVKKIRQTKTRHTLAGRNERTSCTDLPLPLGHRPENYVSSMHV